MRNVLKIALLELYCGKSGKLGFYNSQSLGLAKAYSALGHEVYVIRPDKENDRIVSQKFAEKIMLVNVPAKTFGVHSFYELNFLLDYKIDLVHLNADNQANVPKVIRFCEQNNILVYNYVGTVYSDTENKIKRAFTDYFSKRNIRCFRKSKTFVKTETVMKELQKHGVENCKVVPVGLDFDIIPEIKESKAEIRKKLGLQEDKTVLLYVGRLSTYKRPLDALELLRKMGNKYFLIAIGNGELQEDFIKKTGQFGLESQVKYIEAVPNSDIHYYYRASDCFVNFNPQEIFGMSILEALYQECPVVAKHAPGPDSIVTDSECGYLCDTIEEMCECIGKIDSSMGVRGKCRVKNKFSWTAASKAFLEGMGI